MEGFPEAARGPALLIQKILSESTRHRHVAVGFFYSVIRRLKTYGMLGWNFYLSKLRDGGSLPATCASKAGQTLAVWRELRIDLPWLDELIKNGTAVDLGGDGYPDLYTGTAGILLPYVESRPSNVMRKWVLHDGDTATGAQPGHTLVYRDAIASCRTEEWLLLEAWDES